MLPERQGKRQCHLLGCENLEKVELLFCTVEEAFGYQLEMHH